MIADGIQLPPDMMVKIMSVVVLECVGEAHKTLKDKQGAVGDDVNNGRIVVFDIDRLWREITQKHGVLVIVHSNFSHPNTQR